MTRDFTSSPSDSWIPRELAPGPVLSEIDSLRNEIAELESRNLGLLVELVALRRRGPQKAGMGADEQDGSLIGGLVPVTEALQRAFDSGGSPGSPLLYQGVGMVLQELRQLLREHGVETEKSTQAPADPKPRDGSAAGGYDPAEANAAILRILQQGEHRGGMVLRNLKPIEVAKTGSARARLVERS